MSSRIRIAEASIVEQASTAEKCESLPALLKNHSSNRFADFRNGHSHSSERSSSGNHPGSFKDADVRYRLDALLPMSCARKEALLSFLKERSVGRFFS